MQNRVFFTQAALDQWNVDGSVDFQQGQLTIVDAGRQYELVEAVRVLREVGGQGDAHQLIGRVKERGYFQQLGAEIVQTSMLLDDGAYDIDPGWLGVPVGTFAEYVRRQGGAAPFGSSGGPGTQLPPRSDEELLARVLAKSGISAPCPVA